MTEPSVHSEPQVVLKTLRSGSKGAPLLVVTPGWRESSDYDDLVAALHDEVSVVALEVEEPDDCGEHQLHRFDHFAEVATDLVAELASGRKVALAGASSDGVVAQEVGRRLAERSLPISFVALIDTFYPGRPVLLWTGRWDRYRRMLRSLQIGDMARQLGKAAQVRAGALFRKVSSTRSPVPGAGDVSVGPPRIPGSNVPNEVRLHQPKPSGVPIVLYVAANTLPSGTEKPWRKLEPQLETVNVQGWHGHNLILAPWVVEISEDLSSRLSDLSARTVRSHV